LVFGYSDTLNLAKGERGDFTFYWANIPCRPIDVGAKYDYSYPLQIATTKRMLGAIEATLTEKGAYV